MKNVKVFSWIILHLRMDIRLHSKRCEVKNVPNEKRPFSGVEWVLIVMEM